MSDSSLFPSDLEPYPVVANIEFAEGPICDPEGNLYFVNYVENGTIGRLDRGGTVKVWRRTEGLMLGLKYDGRGGIVATDYGLKRIVRFPLDGGEEEVLTGDYRGEAYNGPNDLCFDQAGNLYFSDPGDNFQEPVGKIYLYRPDGSVQRLDEDLLYPNGIAVSPDQKRLYVSETVTRKILAYDLTVQGVKGKRILFEFPNDGVDGIMFDEFSRLWVARWKNGTLDCLDEQGNLVGSLPAGGDVTNLCWWKDTLYATVAGRHSIHRLEVGFTCAAQSPAGTQ
ncbi:MAG TPA: SMP-30/gluconolactonase/LRE family protein [Acidobacteriota bacterium]|nr:SMP-30/gluconolactonase/LRE family protein [Acidobacteriota bacterium]